MSAPVEFDPETGALPWDGGGIENGRIVSMEGLDRMGGRLADVERGIAENQRLHDAAVKRLEERLERTQGPLQRDAARIRSMVEVFAQEQGRKVICIGRLKSRELPSGLKLAWREQKAGYRYDQRPGPSGRPPTPAENKAALLEWARGLEDGQDFIAKIEVPDLDAIKEHLRELDAEEARVVDATPAPPGLEYVPPEETLTVSVGEEESK